MRHLHVAVLAVSEFTVTAGLTMVVPFLPFHLADLGLTPGQRQLWTGVALVAPAVTLAAASPWWGRLGDRVGRRPMVVRALVGIGGSLFVMAAAGSPVVFVLGRLLQGGFGGVTDASAALVGAAAEPGRRGRILGRLESAHAAGALVGPVLAGELAALVGFRGLFAGAGVASVLTALLAVLVLPREESGAGPAAGPLSDTDVGTGEDPPLGLRPNLIAGMLVIAAAYGLVVVFAPHVAGIAGDQEVATVWVGRLQAVTWAASIAGGIWWGRRTDEGPVHRTLGVAAAACALGISSQAVTGRVGLLVPSRLVQGFAYAAITPAVLLDASRSHQRAEQGVAIGRANRMLVSGQVAGGLVGGAVSSLVATSVAVGAMGGLALAGAAVAALHGARARPSGEVLP